jgi:hypothetical protein
MIYYIGGNVGIGTTNPHDKFDLYNGNLIVRSTAESINSAIYLGTPYDTSSALKVAIIAQARTNFSRANLMFCLDDTGNNTAPTCNASVHNARMTILSNGNEGIGNTNTSNKLEVSGSIKTSGLIVQNTGDTLQTFLQLTNDVGVGASITIGNSANTVVGAGN